MHFGVKLFLLVRKQQDSNVRIRGSTWVHGHEVGSLKDANRELRTEEMARCRWQEQWRQNFIRQQTKVRVSASDWLCNVIWQLKPHNQSPQTSCLAGDVLNVRGFSSVSQCGKYWIKHQFLSYRTYIFQLLLQYVIFCLVFFTKFKTFPPFSSSSLINSCHSTTTVPICCWEHYSNDDEATAHLTNSTSFSLKLSSCSTL